MDSYPLYRLRTGVGALRTLSRLSPQRIEAFLDSYSVFSDESTDGDGRIEPRIIDYYSVLNLLCSLGDVEKMYIPPLSDADVSIAENQSLFESRMARDLGISEGSEVLDLGCGRGRVAGHLARTTGANVTGLNIDAVQLKSAEEFAERERLDTKCRFMNSSFNEPLPFGDDSFDAIYEIQALTYATNKESLFQEMFRVLKPGGKLAFLDWVRYEAYDETNPQHLDLMARVKPLIGAVDTPSPGEIKNLLEKAGLEVHLSQNASVDGLTAPLIDKADRYYRRAGWIIDLLASLRVFPNHFKVLLARFTQDAQAFVEADRLKLCSTSHYTLSQKPAPKGAGLPGRVEGWRGSP